MNHCGEWGPSFQCPGLLKSCKSLSITHLQLTMIKLKVKIGKFFTLYSLIYSSLHLLSLKRISALKSAISWLKILTVFMNLNVRRNREKFLRDGLQRRKIVSITTWKKLCVRLHFSTPLCQSSTATSLGSLARNLHFTLTWKFSVRGIKTKMVFKVAWILAHQLLVPVKYLA